MTLVVEQITAALSLYKVYRCFPIFLVLAGLI